MIMRLRTRLTRTAILLAAGMLATGCGASNAQSAPSPSASGAIFAPIPMPTTSTVTEAQSDANGACDVWLFSQSLGTAMDPAQFNGFAATSGNAGLIQVGEALAASKGVASPTVQAELTRLCSNFKKHA
jgi:hypothetical protein